MADLNVNDVLGPSNVPTTDDILGPVQPVNKQPQSYAGGFADWFFSDTTEGRLLSAFGQGAKEGWGEDFVKTSKEADEWLSKLGVYNDYKTGRKNYIKSFNETFFRPVVTATIAGGKTIGGALGGIAKITGQAGEELQSAGTAIQEKRMTSWGPERVIGGTLGGAGEILGGVAEGFLVPEMIPISRARSRGAIGEGEVGYFNTQAITEGNLQARQAAAREAGLPEPQPKPPVTDINVIAREVNPDLFRRYDELADIQDNLRKSRDYLRASLEPETSPTFDYKKQQDIKAKLETIPDELVKIDSKLRDLIPDVIRTRGVTREWVEGTSKESEAFRKWYQSKLIEQELEIADLKQGIIDSYRHAEELLPLPEIKSPGALQKAVEFDPETGGRKLPEKAETPRVTVVEVPKEGPLAVKPETFHGVTYDMGILEGRPLEDARRLLQNNPGSNVLPTGVTRVKVKTPSQRFIDEHKAATAKRNQKGQSSASVSQASKSTSLPEVEGTGSTRQRGLSKSIEAKAIEENLTDGFGKTEEYKSINLKDQAEKAATLVNIDYEKAKRILNLDEPLPEGLLRRSLFIALEEAAIRRGDVEYLRDLARSGIAKETTRIAQELRVLAEREKESPVSLIEEINKSRQEFISTSEVKATVKELQKHVQDNVVFNADVWSNFIKTIECK